MNPSPFLVPEVVLFNGDADGLCALRLLAAAGFISEQTRLITGAKRETALASRLLGEAVPARLIALDLGLNRNLKAVQQLLEAGCLVQWVDHHQVSRLPNISNFQPFLSAEPGWNTTRIVYHLLEEPQELLPWVLMGLWGDNMGEAAELLASDSGLSNADLVALQQGGELLNYNAYGACIADLCFDPHHLAYELMSYADPKAWIATAKTFQILNATYQSDFQQAQAIQPIEPGIYCLPASPWAQRMMGPFANYLSQHAPHRPIAVLVDSGQGFYTVSLRAPAGFHAAQFCERFETGGGRVASAGINCLPQEGLKSFILEFQDYFGAAFR